jgi:hypothetical protein
MITPNKNMPTKSNGNNKTNRATNEEIDRLKHKKQNCI